LIINGESNANFPHFGKKSSFDTPLYLRGGEADFLIPIMSGSCPPAPDIA